MKKIVKKTVAKPVGKKPMAKKPIKKAQNGYKSRSEIEQVVNARVLPKQAEETNLAYRKRFRGPEPGHNTPVSEQEREFYSPINKRHNEERWAAQENETLASGRNKYGVPRTLAGRDDMGNIRKSGGKVTKAKSGGKVTKKGGMKAFEKSSFDKKADAKGLHGKEGSPKDMKADKTAAKKMGFIKNKKK